VWRKRLTTLLEYNEGKCLDILHTGEVCGGGVVMAMGVINFSLIVVCLACTMHTVIIIPNPKQFG
jgi:hypothetical protein